MTEWKKITGTQPECPAEVDAVSSPTTVYLRRNIKQITQTDENSTASGAESVQMWEYEEREMTVAEYSDMLASLETPATKMIMQSLSALELSMEEIALGMEV